MSDFKPWQRQPYRKTPDTLRCFPMPDTWLPWYELYQIAPHLRELYGSSANQRRPPRPLADSTFLSLAACFSDSRKREVLRALIFDLLKEDLREII